ncbi:hypothetical protein ACWGTI_30440 [Mesorhizobium sp. ArgA1]
MLMKLALAIFTGGVLAYFTLPDQEAGLRVLCFSTTFLILAFAAACVIEFLMHRTWLCRLRAPLQPSSLDDELPLLGTAKPRHSDWSTSGVDSKDPNLVWQYRLNDSRSDRFEL